MEICESGEAFIDSGEDFVYSHSKVIVKEGKQYYYAHTPRRLRSIPNIDLSTLELHPIPTTKLWPKYLSQFSQAPHPLPSNTFVKRPSLLDYGDTPASSDLGSLILSEARVCEIMKASPHPNIVEYLGCLVDEGTIAGLCFVRYEDTLAKRVRHGSPIDRKACLESIADGIRHIHSLGLVHCDIKPDNILMDGTNPRIGDFDSCHVEGKKLGIKAGTEGWAMHESSTATYDLDWYGLSKIKDFLQEVP